MTDLGLIVVSPPPILKGFLVVAYSVKRAGNRIFIFLRVSILGVFLKLLIFGRKYVPILCAFITAFIIVVCDRYWLSVQNQKPFMAHQEALNGD